LRDAVNLNVFIIGSFIGVFGIVTVAYWLFVIVPERHGQGLVRRRLKWENPVGGDTENVQLLKKAPVLSTIEGLNNVLAQFDSVSHPLTTLIQESGVKLTVGSFILITIVAFLAPLVLVQWYLGVAWLALLAAGVFSLVPFFVMKQLRTIRIQKFEEQFPEAIQLIARAMRAGHAFSTGMKMAAEELPEPCGVEFKVLYEQQNFGAALPDALRAFAARIPSLDARFFVTAVLTQREAGGNLAEVLDRLAGVMRERFRIKREVRVKSAHGRITAFVLAAMAPVLAVLMLAQNPDAMQLLLNDPLGHRMIGLAVTLQVVGMLIVRKLVDIQY
jgi:tight adherence protein B